MELAHADALTLLVCFGRLQQSRNRLPRPHSPPLTVPRHAYLSRSIARLAPVHLPYEDCFARDRRHTEHKGQLSAAPPHSTLTEYMVCSVLTTGFTGTFADHCLQIPKA